VIECKPQYHQKKRKKKKEVVALPQRQKGFLLKVTLELELVLWKNVGK
jgi:hypothetical protein